MQIEECNLFPENIKVKKTQLSQPIHHEFGQLPIILVNNSHVVLRQLIWQLIISIFNIQLNRRYQFLSIVNLCQQLTMASNICSQIDMNPYFLLISPWKKYKMYRNIQNLKSFFHQNTQYLNKNDSTLNKQYYLYKLNTLATLLKSYENSTTVDLFKCYQSFVFAFLKHLKMLDDVLAQTALANEIFKDNFQKLKGNMIIKPQIQRQIRAVTFTNVQLPYMLQKQSKNEEKQQKYDPNRPYQRIIQAFFKPIFVTTIFGLGYLGLKE